MPEALLARLAIVRRGWAVLDRSIKLRNRPVASRLEFHSERAKARSFSKFLRAERQVRTRVMLPFHELATEVSLRSELVVRPAAQSDVARAVSSALREGFEVVMVIFEPVSLAAALSGVVDVCTAPRPVRIPRGGRWLGYADSFALPAPVRGFRAGDAGAELTAVGPRADL